MTDRYIIIVDRGDDLLCPIVDAEDDGKFATFPSREAAQDLADDQILCRAFPYSIINFDEVAQ